VPKLAAPARLWTAAFVVALGILAMHQVSHGEAVVPRLPLADLPLALGAWSGEPIPLPERIVDAVGLDDYINRVYRNPGAGAVTLFISYYRTQGTGETIHSPKNCLPGAGWLPLASRRLSIAVAGYAPIAVSEYLVARDTDRVLVLYWYQERGRVIASEYSAKFWLTADAITRDRTDGALVRVTTPVAGDRPAAERRAVAFMRTIFPHLSRYIPN
jgi:EpsI family protein